jgi:glycosyltransferase involved in cell wall biosynthesis
MTPAAASTHIARIALAAPSAIPARRANTVQVMKMAQAMTALGYQVRLAAPSSAAQAPVDWSQLAEHYGLRQRFEVVGLPSAPRLRRWDYAWRAVHWARTMDAGLFYTRLPQAAAIASQAGLPTLFEIHDLPQGRLGPLVFRLFLSGRGAKRLAVITRALLDDLTGIYGRVAALAVVAPDGVDLERFQNLPDSKAARLCLPASLCLPPERFTVGYTGHLYAGRGEALLLELAARLPEMNFVLAGGEPQDVERLRRQAAGLGLANLFVVGFVPNAGLPPYQAACDALLMPYERHVAASSGGDIARYLSPMKLFEYLASGRAIVSSDLPVLREVLNESNAVLLPPQDAGAWAAALRLLQADPQQVKELGRRARREAANYTWEARAARLLEGLV